ncbi:hypothetical protein GCM10009000_077650 [Halobacterium noricense]|uniref:Glycosyl hydrolase family 95 catalytic domain-containing protein n=1 Tax=Haladaptatus pallidirubidus TaxID=1008152 RepID=A0AAV3UPA8_9EURY|nr:hypothetical protein [Haladaptatus pallidirubidus]
MEGDGVTTQTVAWQEEDVLAIGIEDKQEAPGAITATVRALRPPVVETKHHTATSTVDASEDRITLVQTFEEGEHYCTSAIAIGIVGRSVRMQQPTQTEAQLVAEPGQESFTVLIATAANFDRDVNVAAVARERLDHAVAEGADGIRAANERWWKEFWSRAFVHLRSEDGAAEEVEKHYTYFLYLMESSSRGSFPPNFGGMLWNTDGDYRRWGAQQWWTNLSLYYRGLFPSNGIELTDPLFELYSGMRGACATAARQQWGSEGIYVPETTCFNGLADLPDDIAEGLRVLYLLEKTWEMRSQQFREFAAAKHPHTSRWNWKAPGRFDDGHWTYTDKGTGPFGEVNHFFASGPELAYLYWKRYEYTRDGTWLREYAYPMLRGVAEFFRHYSNLTRDPDGVFHLHHVNHSEPVLGAKDPFDALVGLHGILPAAINAAKTLNVDADLQSKWFDLLENLVPLPTSDHPDSIHSRDGDGPRIWASAFTPAASLPNPDSLWGEFDVRCRYYDFDIATLETRNPCENPERFELAEATFEQCHPNGVGLETRVPVMSSLGVIAARLGRASDLKNALLNQIRAKWPEEDFVEFDETGQLAVLPNRYDTARRQSGTRSATARQRRVRITRGSLSEHSPWSRSRARYPCLSSVASGVGRRIHAALSQRISRDRVDEGGQGGFCGGALPGRRDVPTSKSVGERSHTGVPGRETAGRRGRIDGDRRYGRR